MGLNQYGIGVFKRSHYGLKYGLDRTASLTTVFRWDLESVLVRAVGLEPTRAINPPDFKSGMSTIPSRPHQSGTIRIRAPV